MKEPSLIHQDLSAHELLLKARQREEGQFTKDGAFVVLTQPTGRSPKDKLVVPSERLPIWFGPVNSKITKEDFEKLLLDVQSYLKNQKELFVQNLFIGSGEHKRHVRFLTTRAWNAAFVDRLYIVPEEKEALQKREEVNLTILHAPHFKADPKIHGTKSDIAIAMDFDTGTVIIAGTEYGGETKKSGFTYMNGEMPMEGVLPMHSSAVITQKEETAVFFGLSGTGKTTLSADKDMFLIGDDEHGWDKDGVFNFEGGCYPKAIRLTKTSEPEIWEATNREDSIMENVVIKEGGIPDFDDDTLTENTRVAFTLQDRIEWEGKGGHPKNILFLCADASGVLPPLAKLTIEQAIYYFISGYTSKVAGTEKGIITPQPTFSACFGQPFLPLHPSVYAELFSKKIYEQQEIGQKINIWMVNTGWNGTAYNYAGQFNPVERMELKLTRSLVRATINGDMDNVKMQTLPTFNLQIPIECPEVNPNELDPRNSWKGKISLYEKKKEELAGQFGENFKKYEQYVSENIRRAGPKT